jgi:hypothetical protein
MMTWTYTDPLNIPKDQVRLLIGDTLSVDPLLYDEEINALLDDPNNLWLVAHHCANAIASKYSRLVDTAVGKTKITYSQKSAQYIALADKLEYESNWHKTRAAMPYSGAVLTADKTSTEQDQSLVDPMFKRTEFDYPGTAPDVDLWSDDNG